MFPNPIGIIPLAESSYLVSMTYDALRSRCVIGDVAWGIDDNRRVFRVFWNLCNICISELEVVRHNW
jgi:hypothetical protein